jgi:hypothetical protein
MNLNMIYSENSDSDKFHLNRRNMMLSKLFRYSGECSRASPSIFYPLILLLSMTVSMEVFASITFKSVSAGGYHTCGVKTDNSVVCWGRNNSGQASPPNGTFIQISGGTSHTCGRKTNGSVVCWGRDYHGQPITSPGGIFTQVSAGHDFTCGVKTDRSVTCWGNNDSYQATPPPGKIFIQVSAGESHTCGVNITGRVTCWGFGYGEYGQNILPDKTLTQVSTGIGGEHTCGVKTDDSVICWGYNKYGQATPPHGSFTQVSAGSNHTCGVKTDGRLACWGKNEDGQSTPPNGTFSQISNNCGLKTDGSVVCWGNNRHGQSIPPSMVSPTLGTTPLTVTLDVTNIVGTSMLDYKWYANNQLINAGNLASHTFTEHGKYVIKLIAKHSDGSMSETIENIRVMSPPIPKFTVTPLQGQTVKLDASGSHDPDGSIVSYKWTINGQTIVGMIATTTLNNDNKITLTIIDNDGLTASENTPTKDLSYTLSVSKNGFGNGRITGQDINCGSNCSEEYGKNTQVILTANPNIGFTFSNWSDGCSGTGVCQITMNKDQHVIATFALNIVENQPPVAVITATPNSNIGPAPWLVKFNANESSDTDGSISEYAWSIDSGQNINRKDFTTDFEVGTHTATLKVKDNEGAWSTTQRWTVQVEPPKTRLINLSTRASIQGGANDVIAGFIITGTDTQKVIIRGWGLEAGVNPKLILQKYPSGELVAINDNWQTDSRFNEIPAHLVLPNPTDAGLLLELPVGAYTATLSSVSAKGLGLIGVDEVEPSQTAKLINLSTRASIQGGANDMIAGLIITGTGTKKVMIRGFALEAGVDPKLTLQKYPSGETVASNNNWQTDPRASEIPAHLQLPNPTDAGLLLDLQVGAYTVILSSLGAKGLGLVGVDAVE